VLQLPVKQQLLLLQGSGKGGCVQQQLLPTGSLHSPHLLELHHLQQQHSSNEAAAVQSADHT
jgi:hypothetical protein